MINTDQKTFILTKKIARHGSQSAILMSRTFESAWVLEHHQDLQKSVNLEVPKFLQQELKPKTVVEVKISIIKEAQNDI